MMTQSEYKVKTRHGNQQSLSINMMKGHNTVRTGDSTQYRRNRRHLLKTNESVCQKSMFDSFPDILDHKDTDLNCTLNSPTFSEETVVHNSQNFKVPVNNTNEPPCSYVTSSGRVIKPKVIVSV